MKGVQDWGPHLKTAFNLVHHARKLSKLRRDHPLMENLSDDQLLSAKRKAMIKIKRANAQRAPAVTTSASQQPHGQADGADHSSAQEDDQKLPESSAGHSKWSEADSGTHASNDGQLSPGSQNTDAVQSPANVGTQAPAPSGALGTPAQSEIPTSSGGSETPISDASSSGAPPALPPVEPGTHQQQQPSPQPAPAQGALARLNVLGCSTQ